MPSLATCRFSRYPRHTCGTHPRPGHDRGTSPDKVREGRGTAGHLSRSSERSLRRRRPCRQARMTRDVRIGSSQGIIVRGWKSGSEGLLLEISAQDEDFRLVCRCGRGHWLVREQFSGGVASLSVTCHSCGTRGTFVMEHVTLPAP